MTCCRLNDSLLQRAELLMIELVGTRVELKNNVVWYSEIAPDLVNRLSQHKSRACIHNQAAVDEEVSVPLFEVAFIAVEQVQFVRSTSALRNAD